MAIAGSLPKVPVTALAFSPDSKTLITAGYRELLVWDSAGKLARRIPGLPPKIRALAFSPDGATVAAAAGDPGRSGAILLIDFAGGRATTIHNAADEMLAAAFSPDGKLLAAGGSDSMVQIWTLADRKSFSLARNHTGAITSVAFSPDGKLLATASLDKTVRVWETANWSQRVQLPKDLTEPVNGVAFSPENDLLAFAVAGNDERAVRTWRTQNTVQQTRPFDTGTCLPLALTYISRPSRLLTACNDTTLRLIGPNGNTLATLSGHTDWVYAVAASPDGQRIASGSADGTVKLWNSAGKLTGTLAEESK
jgi:WD40 repeat protein